MRYECIEPIKERCQAHGINSLKVKGSFRWERSLSPKNLMKNHKNWKMAISYMGVPKLSTEMAAITKES